MIRHAWPLVSVIAVAGVLAGCAASNVADLRADPTGTLTAHSPDSVPITARRISTGIEQCENISTRAQVFGADMPADVAVDTPSMMGGVSANAHLVPADTGADVEITYKHFGWRKTAERMQKLASGGATGCE